MRSAALFSHERDDWATPKWLFERLDAEFHFTLDPCASDENATCPRFYTKAEDGLTRPWSGSVFLNPPYGRPLGRWLEKAQESARAGATVVCLLPSRTDTGWFHDLVLPHAREIRFFRGRLRFQSATHSAPFPSLLVVFGPDKSLEPGPLLLRSVRAEPTGSEGQPAGALDRIAAQTTKAALP